MKADVPATPHAASTPDPQDRPGDAMPEYIAALLHTVGILLGYGRHLLATVRQRATAPTFPAIAACFGTANLATIHAHLNRGILRATALQNMLLARAETGRDISIVIRRTRTDEPPPAPATPQVEQPAAQPASPKAVKRPSLFPGSDNPELFMPTLEEIERQVRRRAVGRTINEICRDLAVDPGFCTAAFWNDLFQFMHHFGGSVETLMREKTLGEQKFIQEHDRKIGSTLDWLRLKRDESARYSASSSANHRSTHSLNHRHRMPPPPLTHRRLTTRSRTGPDAGRPRCPDSPGRRAVGSTFPESANPGAPVTRKLCQRPSALTLPAVTAGYRAGRP